MLHGRLAPIRSAEYGIPVFGVWSSGVSQLTDRHGKVIATASYPGQGAMIAGPLDMSHSGKVPVDRWLAMGAVGITVGFVAFLIIGRIRRWSSDRGGFD
jgi:hypothetical protein